METTENKQVDHTESPPQSQVQNKWTSLRDFFARMPRSVFVISMIFISIIVALIIYYETREYPHRHSRYDRPQDTFRVYHLDPYSSYWELDDPFDRWDHYHRMMLNRQQRLWDQIHNMNHTVTVSVPQNGKYTGTRIIGDDILTYDISLDSGSLTGSYRTTGTGNLGIIGDKLKGLGYTLTASGNQYSFSGKSENISKILDLFR